MLHRYTWVGDYKEETYIVKYTTDEIFDQERLELWKSKGNEEVISLFNPVSLQELTAFRGLVRELILLG